MLASLKKPRYQVAGLLIIAVIGRIWYLHFERRRLWQQLTAKYDEDRDLRLKTSQVIDFLKRSNINITRQQFDQWASHVDDENDGFDEGELLQVAEIFDDFQGASPELQKLGLEASTPIGASGVWEGFLSILILVAGVSSLKHVDGLEKKWAATSFGSAVKMSKMRKSWQSAEDKVKEFEKKQQEVADKIKMAEERLSSETASDAEKKALQEKLEGLHAEAEEMRKKLDNADSAMQAVRTEAQTHMEDAHMSTKRLKDMQQYMRYVCGSFHGASKGEFESKGAAAGFCSGGQNMPALGCTMSTFVFGYPAESGIELFQVDKKRDMLGEGVDCAYRCRSIATGEEFALKIYEIGKQSQKRQIVCDLHAQQQIGSHPNIVKYHRVIEAEKEIFVMMELIKGVDLFTYVQQKGGVKEGPARGIFLQVCDALKWLHEKSIIHGDIKTENVMIGSPDAEKPHAKVIDFGFTCFLNSDSERLQLRGDMYATPESFLGTQPATFATDIWRTGCMLYVMLAAGLPFPQPGASQQRNGQVIKTSRFLGLSTDAKDLILKMTAKDPLQRPDIHAVMAHPWCQA